MMKGVNLWADTTKSTQLLLSPKYTFRKQQQHAGMQKGMRASLWVSSNQLHKIKSHLDSFRHSFQNEIISLWASFSSYTIYYYHQICALIATHYYILFSEVIFFQSNDGWGVVLHCIIRAVMCISLRACKNSSVPKAYGYWRLSDWCVRSHSLYHSYPVWSLMLTSTPVQVSHYSPASASTLGHGTSVSRWTKRLLYLSLF